MGMRAISGEDLLNVYTFLDPKEKEILYATCRKTFHAYICFLRKEVLKKQAHVEDPEKKSLITQALGATLISQRDSLKALLAALSQRMSEPASFQPFRQIATVDIPDSVSRRCWEIELNPHGGSVFYNPNYGPITTNSLSAFIEANKRRLLEPLHERCRYACVPSDMISHTGKETVPISKEQQSKVFDEINSAVNARLEQGKNV